MSQLSPHVVRGVKRKGNLPNLKRSSRLRWAGWAWEKNNLQNEQPAKSAANKEHSKTEEQPAQVEKEVYEEVLIGQQNVELAIPAHVIRQAQLASSESKNKLSGYWSAQIIKGNPHIMKSSLSDPVAIWFEVKNVILKKFNST